MSEIILEDKKSKRSVGRRLTLLIIIMIAAISFIVVFLGYLKFRNTLELYYIDTGESLARVASNFIQADSIDRYLETLQKDEEYEKTLQNLSAIREDSTALYLCVLQPREDGYHYVFDVTVNENGVVGNELGYVEPFWEEQPEYTAQIMNRSENPSPIITKTMYGWLLTVTCPLYGSDGSVKGYACVDFSMNKVTEECTAYVSELAVIVLIITVVFSVFFLYIVRKTVVVPINIMSQAAENFLVSSLDEDTVIGDSNIMKMNIKTKDELQSLAESLKLMEHKINEFVMNLNIVTLKSETDNLTKLLNREAFRHNVSSHLRNRSRGHAEAFMMIDVDYFKAVNDNYGHTAGDIVLEQCADALRKNVRTSDFIGRQGGDEFVVFLRSIHSVEEAEAKARDIIKAWRKIIPQGADSVNDAVKHITASIGISILKSNDKDSGGGNMFDELFAEADAALYEAKEEGRDRFVTNRNGQTDVNAINYVI